MDGTTHVRTGTLINDTALNSFSRFDVEEGAHVNLKVPDSAARLINLVHDEQTDILGLLTSEQGGVQGRGNIYFLNPYGVVVGKDGIVDVGALTVVTPTESFMEGFFDDASASVDQLLEGSIPISPSGLISIQGTVKTGGNASFIGGRIEHDGSITTGVRNVTGGIDLTKALNLGGLDVELHLEERDGSVALIALGDVEQTGSIATGSAYRDAGHVLLGSTDDISLSGGASIFAQGGSGGDSGDITLLALRRERPTLGKAEATNLIELADATLQGRNVTLRAKSDAKYGWNVADGLEGLNPVFDTVSSLGEHMIGVNVAVAIAEAQAGVTLGSGTVIEAEEAVEVTADAKADASLISAGGGLYASLGFAYGRVNSRAAVDVLDGARIKASNLNLSATNTANLSLNVRAQGFVTDPQAEFAIAVGDASVAARANVAQRASIEVNEDVSVSAINHGEFGVTANAIAQQGGKAGLAASVLTADTAADTTVAADLEGVGDVVVEAFDDTASVSTQASGQAGSGWLQRKFIFNPWDNFRGKIFNWLQSKMGKTKELDTRSGATAKVKLAAAASIADFQQRASATVADDADVSARGSVAVLSEASVGRIQTGAVSAVEADGQGEVAGYTLSVAFAYGDYDQDSKARIGHRATVIGQNVAVHSKVRRPIEMDLTRWTDIGAMVDQFKDLLPTSIVRATGESENIGLAGSISYLNFSREADATLGRGATVRIRRDEGRAADGSWTLERADGSEFRFASPVSVAAEAESWGIFVGGNLSYTFGGANGSPGGIAVGAAYNHVASDTRTRAAVLEGAQIKTLDEEPEEALDVTVSATNTQRIIALGPSAGRGASYGLSGVFTLVDIDGGTEALVSDRATVEARRLDILANTDLLSWNITGAFNLAESLGFGVNISLQDVDFATRAFIGDNSEGGQTYPQGRIVAQDLGVFSRTEGLIGSVSVAGTMAYSGAEKSNAKSPEKLQDVEDAADDAIEELEKKTESPSGEVHKPKFGLAVSGSSSVNTTRLETAATVENALLALTGGALDVRGVSDTDIIAASGSAALAMAKNQSTSFSGGIAGAIGFNDLKNDTVALVRGATVTGARGVLVQALAGGDQYAIALGLAVNASADKDKAAEAAGSVSVSMTENAVEAGIETSDVTGVGSEDAGDVAVVAYDRTLLATGGGSLVAGGKGGVGASITYSRIRNAARGHVSGSTVTGFEDASVQGLTASLIGAGSGAAALTVDKDTGTFAGAVVVSEMENTAAADVLQSEIEVADAVDVTGSDTAGVAALDALIAEGREPGDGGERDIDFDFGDEIGAASGDGSRIIAVAGVAQAGGNNVGISFAWTKMNNTFRALVEESSITSETTLVRARTSALNVGYAVGVGGAYGQFAGGGSIAVNQMENDVLAQVRSSNLHRLSAGKLVVEASDDSQIDGLAGQVTLANGGVSAGAAVAHNATSGSVIAAVTGVDVNVDGEVAVAAENAARVRTLAAAGGVSKGKGSAQGSGASSHIANTTEALIQGAAITGSKSRVSVTAQDHSEISSLSGAAAFAGKAAGEAAVSVNRIANTTRARVSGSAAGTTYEVGQLVVDADSNARIRTLAIGGAASSAVSIGGSVATNFIENTTEAFINEGARVLARDNVGVLATGDTAVTTSAGNVAVGGTVTGIGASASGTEVGGVTRAFIEGEATEVTALARTLDRALEVYNGELEGEVDLSAGLDDLGDFSRIDLRAQRGVERVRGVVVRAAGGNVQENVVANAGGGKWAGLSGAVNVYVLDGVTEAYIDRARVNTSGSPGGTQTVSVKAFDHAFAHGFGGSAAGAAAAFGASIDTTAFERVTRAFIQNSDAFHAAGDIVVEAHAARAASSFAAGVAGGIGGVVGSGSVVTYAGETEAFVFGSELSAGDVRVKADNTSQVFMADGGVIIGGPSAAGTFSVVDTSSRVRAYVEESALEVDRNVNVEASNRTDLELWSVSGAGGGGAAATFSLSVALLDDRTEAFVKNSSLGDDASPVQHVSVNASDDVSVIHRAGGAGASVMGMGIGLAGSVTRIDNTTLAYVEDSSVYADDDVRLSALADREVHSVTASAGVGVYAGTGLAGAVGVTLLGRNLSGGAADELGLDGGVLTDADRMANRERFAAGENVATGLGLQEDDMDRLNRVDRIQVRDDLGSTTRKGETAALVLGVSHIEGNDVAVTARERLALASDVGGGALADAYAGSAGVGVTEAHLNVRADVSGEAAVVARRSIDIKAGVEKLRSGESAVRVNAYQGAAALVGAMGAAVAVVELDANVHAHVGRGAQLQAGSLRSITLRAWDDSEVSAHAEGYTVAGAAAGAVIARANRSGDVTALLGAGASGSTSVEVENGSLIVEAERSGDVRAFARAGSGGVLSGAGVDARAGDDGGIVARIGDATQVDAGGSEVRVNATARPRVFSVAKGYGGTVGAYVGVSLARAEVGQAVEASVGKETHIDAGTLDVVASAETDRSASSAMSEAEAAGGGLLIGVGATESVSENTARVAALVEGSLTVTGQARIAAVNETRQRARVSGVVGGVVGVGANKARSRSDTSTSAVYAGPAVIAGSFELEAQGAADNEARAKSGSGGVVSGAAASAETESVALTTAGIAQDANILTGRFEMTAQHTVGFFSASDSTDASVAGKSGASSKNTMDSSVTAEVAEDAVITADDIVLSALNAFLQNEGDVSARAGAGGVFTGAAAKSVTEVTGDTQVDIGSNSTLAVVGDPGDDPGSLEIALKNHLDIVDRSLLSTGGAVQGPYAESNVTADLDGRISVGYAADLSSVGSFRIGAYTQANASANALVKTYGGISDAGGRAHATVDAANAVHVARDASLFSFGNMVLAAGESADGWWRNRIQVNAAADVYNYTAAPVDTTHEARATAENSSTINMQDAVVEGVNDVTLAAYDGQVDTTAHGYGYNPYLEILGTRSSDGEASRTLTGSIILTGTTVRAGVMNDQRVRIDRWGRVNLGPLTRDVNWSSTSLNPKQKVQEQIDALWELEGEVSEEEWNEILIQIEMLELLKAGLPSTSASTLVFDDIYAAGGNIQLHGRSFGGTSARLEARGAPTIEIINESDQHLFLNRLTIADDDLGGLVRFTGLAGREDANERWQIEETGQGVLPQIIIHNTYDAGSEGPAIFLNGPVSNLRGSVEIYNRSGRLAQFAALEAQTVQIDVPKGTYVVNDPEGYWSVGGTPWTAWTRHMLLPATEEEMLNLIAAFLWGDEGDLNEYLRDPRDMMYSGEDGKAKSGGLTTVLTNLPNCYGTFEECHPGEDRSDYIKLFGGDDDHGFWMRRVREGATLSRTRTYESGDHRESVRLVGQQIAVNAKYIDINGTLRSGRPTHLTVTIGEAAEGWVRWMREERPNEARGSVAVPVGGVYYDHEGNETAGLLWTAAADGHDGVQLRYNFETDQFEIERINAGGSGSIYLHGHIVATNRLGQLEVLGGIGDVEIRNLTRYGLAVEGISTGTSTQSSIKIADTARDRTTWYIYEPGQSMRVYEREGIHAGGPKSEDLVRIVAGRETTYQPLTGQRYFWRREATMQRQFGYDFSCGDSDANFYNLCQPSDWKFVIPDSNQPNNPWTHTWWLSTGHDPNGPDFISEVVWAQVSDEKHTVDFVDTSKGLPDGQWSYHLPEEASITVDSSIRADYPFAIRFRGESEGRVAIISRGDILLGGDIENTQGDTELRSDEGRILQHAERWIRTGNLTMHADGDIASVDQPLRIDLHGGELVVESESGGVALNLTGEAAIRRIAADSEADVLLIADEDIVGIEGGAQPHIVGGAITLRSETGAIGSADTRLVVRGDELDIAADQSIRLTHEGGDLRLVQAVSHQGDVDIRAEEGRILNAAIERSVDAEREQRLAQVWDTLHLTEDRDALEDAQDATVRPFEIQVERRYEEYWQLRRHGSEEGGVFVLDPESIPIYRIRAAAALGVDDPSDAQVQAYAQGLYQEVADFLAETLGEEWQLAPEFQSYRSDYTYTATEEQVAALTYGAAWLPSQLLYQIDANALEPVSDTNVWTQDPNVSGRDVSLVADGIGDFDVPVLIELPLEPDPSFELTDEQKAALVAAAMPGDVTVRYGEQGRPLSIAIQRTRPVYVDAAGVFTAVSHGNVYIFAPDVLKVRSVTSNGDVRLVARDDLLSVRAPGEAAVVAGGDLVLESGEGSIGTWSWVPDGNDWQRVIEPFAYDIGGILGSARAGDDLFLERIGGDMRFGLLYAEDEMELWAKDGSILAEQAGLSLVAGSLMVLTAGDFSGPGDGMEIEVDELFAGEVGGVTRVQSWNAPIIFGNAASATNNFTSLGGLEAHAEEIRVGMNDSIYSDGTVQLFTSEKISMDRGAMIVSSGNVLLQAASISMQDHARVVGDDVYLDANQSMTLNDLTAFGKIELTAGDSIEVQGVINSPLLRAVSRGGQRYTSTSNHIERFRAENAGGGLVELANGRSIVIEAIIQADGGDVVIRNTGSVQLTGLLRTQDGVRLTAGGAIRQEGDGRVVGASSLVTASRGGQSLTGANEVAHFTATNEDGGDVHLVNTAHPLTVHDVTQAAGGDVIIDNAGALVLEGTIAADDVVLTSNATIEQRDAGRVHAALLETTSLGGQLLRGANQVSSFKAANKSGGTIHLVNTAASLKIGDVTQKDGSSVRVENTGDVVTDGTISTADAVYLTATGSLFQTDTGRVAASSLETESRGGQSLTGKNAIAHFTAVNAGGGEVHLYNIGGALTLHDVRQSDGGDVVVLNLDALTMAGAIEAVGEVQLIADGALLQTGQGRVDGASRLVTESRGGQALTGANRVARFMATNEGGGDVHLSNSAASLVIDLITQWNGGDVRIDNTGAIAMAGTVSTNDNDKVYLTATGSLSQTNRGRIVAEWLKTESRGGQSLTGPNEVTHFTAANEDGGDVHLVNVADLLTVHDVSQLAGGHVRIDNTGAVVMDGTISTADEVYLTATGSLSQTDTGRVAASSLETESRGGQRLAGDNTIAHFTAVNAGGGEVQLHNIGGALTLHDVRQSDGGDVAVEMAGAVTMAGAIETADRVEFISGGTLSQTGEGRVDGASWLVTNSRGGQALIGANTVAHFTATNEGGGDVRLVNTADVLTVHDVVQAAGGNVVVDNVGKLLLAGAVTTEGDVRLAASKTIEQQGDGRVEATWLWATSRGGQSLIGANRVAHFTATNGDGSNVHLVNAADPLTVHDVVQAAGGAVVIDNTGALVLEGTLSTADHILLASDETIEQRDAGRVHAAVLEATSRGGQALTGDNAVARFVATNKSGGTIHLVNTVASLILGDVTQVDGDSVRVENTGDVVMDGTISTADEVFVTATGSLSQTDTGRVAASILETESRGGQSLTGENAIAHFTAVNAGGGEVHLYNIGGALTLHDVLQTDGGDVVVESAGTVTMVGVIETADRLALTAGGTLLQAGEGRIHGASWLVTNSREGQALTGANRVAHFTATNEGGGDVRLVNTADALTVHDVLQAAGGDVVIDNRGQLLLVGVLGAKGEVSLTATEAIEQQDGGHIDAAWLKTASRGGQTLTGANTVAHFAAVNDAGGDVRLVNTADPLTVHDVVQASGGDIVIDNTGKLLLAGVLQTEDEVSLRATETIEQQDGGRIDAEGLQTASRSGQTLTGANAVARFAAVNDNGGDVRLVNEREKLTLHTVVQRDGGDIRVDTAGELEMVEAVRTPDRVELTLRGPLVQTVEGRVEAGWLAVRSRGGQFMMGDNEVENFDALNEGGGPLHFANTTGLFRIHNVTQVDGGEVNFRITGEILMTGTLSTPDEVVLQATRRVTQTIEGRVVEASQLTVVSRGGQILKGWNSVARFVGINHGGPIRLLNVHGGFQIPQVVQLSDGDVIIANVGVARIHRTTSALGRTVIDSTGSLTSPARLNRFRRFRAGEVSPGEPLVFSKYEDLVDLVGPIDALDEHQEGISGGGPTGGAPENLFQEGTVL
ncbi:MAG: leukotoxin LktA family filamentous adhesin [Firmicutes bacterium]|nr:leukotoxin LktA family filamentous adhesin [Bacillota bacterium]